MNKKKLRKSQLEHKEIKSSTLSIKATPMVFGRRGRGAVEAVDLSQFHHQTVVSGSHVPFQMPEVQVPEGFNMDGVNDAFEMEQDFEPEIKDHEQVNLGQNQNGDDWKNDEIDINSDYDEVKDVGDFEVADESSLGFNHPALSQYKESINYLNETISEIESFIKSEDFNHDILSQLIDSIGIDMTSLSLNGEEAQNAMFHGLDDMADQINKILENNGFSELQLGEPETVIEYTSDPNLPSAGQNYYRKRIYKR